MNSRAIDFQAAIRAEHSINSKITILDVTVQMDLNVLLNSINVNLLLYRTACKKLDLNPARPVKRDLVLEL